MAEAVFVQDGRLLDYTPSGDVSAGQVVVQGDLVGVATRPIAANERGGLVLEGVFDFAKAGGAGVTFAVGALAYWDNTNNLAVATDGSGANKLLGKATRAAVNADTTVRVRLCPCAVPAPESEE